MSDPRKALAAEGIVVGAERHDGADPVSLGVGGLTGFAGEVRWDATKPDGQPRRALDTSRASERLGSEAGTPFEEGLRRTIDWYEVRRSSDD